MGLDAINANFAEIIWLEIGMLGKERGHGKSCFVLKRIKPTQMELAETLAEGARHIIKGAIVKPQKEKNTPERLTTEGLASPVEGRSGLFLMLCVRGK